jgi:hypothetical protein
VNLGKRGTRDEDRTADLGDRHGALGVPGEHGRLASSEVLADLSPAVEDAGMLESGRPRGWSSQHEKRIRSERDVVVMAASYHSAIGVNV